MTSSYASLYTLAMLAGLGLSLFVWTRVARKDHRLPLIYAGAVCGAFLGAKLAFVLAEGWMYFESPDAWLKLASGKSITGALLGGYLGVELFKHLLGYRAPTGDMFAIVVPLGIMFGRVGCLIYGCCPGVDLGWGPWPAAELEFSFNALALALSLIMTRLRILPHQHFHLYLVGYGVFRFFHEFLRATPKVMGGYSGYHVFALAIFALGVTGFLRRHHRPAAD